MAAKKDQEVVTEEVVTEEVVKLAKLTNNTKGLRGVAGHKLLPGQSVELTREQVVMVNKNPVAMAWIKAGDLTLA